MENPKIPTLTSAQIVNADKLGWSDAFGDPVNEVLTELTDMAAKLAKDRLRELHDLPPEEVDPLPKNSVLHRAKTAEELGFTDADFTPLDLKESEVPPKK